MHNDNRIADLCFKLFVSSGDIGSYELYRRLTDKDEEI